MRNNPAMAGLGIALIAVIVAASLLTLGGKQERQSAFGLGSGDVEALAANEAAGTGDLYNGLIDMEPRARLEETPVPASVPEASVSPGEPAVSQTDISPELEAQDQGGAQAANNADAVAGAHTDTLDITTGSVAPEASEPPLEDTSTSDAGDDGSEAEPVIPPALDQISGVLPQPVPEPAEDSAKEVPLPSTDQAEETAVQQADQPVKTGDARLDAKLLDKPTDYPLVAVYFDGSNNSGLRLAVSFDGLRWREVTGDYGVNFKPTVGRYGVFRDPSFDRGPDGVFRMVWTAGKDGFAYARSTDLIHWEDVRYIRAGGEVFAGKDRVDTWAPEVFYDSWRKEFVVTFASSTAKVPTLPTKFKGNMESYFVTTKDFETFSEAKKLLSPHPDVFEIDSALFQGATDYIVYLKVEATNRIDGPKDGIYYAFADKLDGPWSSLRKLNVPSMRRNSEGPSPVQVGGRYIVYYDKTPGMQAARTSDFKHWEDITDQLVPPTNYRHGTIRNLSLHK